MLFFAVVIGLLLTVESRAARLHQPSEEEIFGFLQTDLETRDLLYICDFFKNHNYLCNVTQLGSSQLKSGKEVKKVPENSGKIVIPNVSGHWSDSDGFMKSSYIKLDYMDIVAKCFFRTEYYECFGVPRCDNDPAVSPCSGGEPWRGSFQGNPKIGFTGNITAEAMQSSGDGQIVTTPEPDNSTYDNGLESTTELPIPIVQPKAANQEATPSSNITADGHQVFVKNFSKNDNKTGVSSEGMIEIIPDQGTVIVRTVQRINRTHGGGHVQGSASSFSQSSSSSSGQKPFGSPFGDSSSGDFFPPFLMDTETANVSGNQTANPSRPAPLFPSLFSPNFFGSNFFGGGMGDQNVNTDTEQQPDAMQQQVIVSAPPPASGRVRDSSCSSSSAQSSPRDFSSLRCMIVNFQNYITSSILSSLQSSLSGMSFENRPMRQQQGMPQARMNFGNPFPFGFQSMSQPRFRSLFSSSDDDDTDTSFGLGFRK